jgi:hypothetical protein
VCICVPSIHVASTLCNSTFLFFGAYSGLRVFRWQTSRPCGDVDGRDCRLLCMIMCLNSLESKDIEIKLRSIAPLRNY